ncbi:OmpA family protein [Lacihabitans sp. CS3-21]|nr:OmpA family protein [Lacihabitans sp. CS3-21]
MVRGFVFLVFCLFTSVNISKAFVPENIKLKVVVINSFDGNQLQSNFTVKVTLDPGGQEIKLINNKKETYYDIPRGKVLKISVTAVGFYNEVKSFESENLSDGDILEIQLNPKPSGRLQLTTIDADTKDPVSSDVEIVFFSRTNKEKINEQNPQILYYYELKGKYKITTNAKGYLKDTRELELDIDAEQKTETVVIELIKNRMQQEISLFDLSTNLKISAGTVSINHMETGQKIFDGKIENGRVLFDGNRNDNYTIITTVPGFMEFKSPFVLDGKPKKYGLSPSSSLQIDVFDEESSERLGIELEITSPTGKKSKLNTSNKQAYSYVPTETGTYSIASKANGYINRSGSFFVKSLAAGSTFYTFRLKKGSNEYVISVFDFETKNPINNAIIKVYSEQSKEIAGKVTKNQKSVNLDAEKKHFFEVSAIGYNDFTANVETNKSIEVFLKKKVADVLETFEITVVDEQTKIPIKDARLRVFESDNKAIALSFDPSRSVFISNKVNPKLSYNYEASAKGYNNLKQRLDLTQNKIQLVMTAFEISNFYFSAIDAFTKEKIDANFKIQVEKVEIKQDLEGDRKRVSLSATNNYSLEVKKDNFKSISKVIDRREAVNSAFVVPLFRESYPILFKVNNKLDPSKTPEIKATLKTKNDNKSEELSFNLDKNGFLGNISSDGNYTLQIQIPDFENYTGAFMLNQANPESLEYLLTLKPLKKAIEKVDKPVIETPKEEKVIAAKVQGPPSAALDIKKGIKYPLEGVNFEKSKTILVKGAESKLDGVVEYLKQNPKAQIEIAGHTDNEGLDQRLNQRLSEFRAKVVANYLFNKGIASERIITIGKGSTEPIVPNDTDENKAKNRRIEIMILED